MNVIKYIKRFSKLQQEEWATFRLNDYYKINAIYNHTVQNRLVAVGTLIKKEHKKIKELPTQFLCEDTDTPTRADAISLLKKFYPRLNEETDGVVLTFRGSVKF
jgi:hypothetical protein